MDVDAPVGQGWLNVLMRQYMKVNNSSITDRRVRS
jgi:hypothetical protein